MNSQTLRRLFLLTILLVVSSAMAAGVYSRASQSQKKSKQYGRTYEAAKVTEAPKVISHIKGLEISGVSLTNEGTPEAALTINVTNNRDEAVMALDFIAGSKGDYSGLLFDGLQDEDKPLVIIPPHTLKTFTWHLGAINEGETVILAAAVFSDGKEEGEKRFLEGMKKGRLRDQEKRRAEKVKNGGQK